MSANAPRHADGLVDLRSDTVTRPDAAMRRAMAEADVGDDVYGEDPTVRRLEETAAALFGKEAGLLCPSGVQCNLVGLLSLATRGTEVLVEADAHLVNYEAGAGAMFAGVQFRTVQAPDGLFDADLVAAHIRPDHFPLTATSLVAIEQTHNRRGGTAYTPEALAAIGATVREAGLPLYMDGARVFNAVEATGSTTEEQGRQVTALSFCLSKALGAPVGSVFVGPDDVVDAARGWRRRLGGAMRQSGVIAAAGLVALEQGPGRLAQDHEHARMLYDAARAVLPGEHPIAPPTSNIVYVDGVDAPAIVAGLRERGILAGSMDPTTLRMVTHRDVDTVGITRATDALKTVLAS